MRSEASKAARKREEEADPGCHGRRSKKIQARPEVKEKKRTSAKAQAAREEEADPGYHSRRAKAQAVREEAQDPGCRSRRMRETSLRPDVEAKKQAKWDAKRLRKEAEMREKLSDEEFAKWQRDEATRRRAADKMNADAATVRSVFPGLMARDICKHRRDGTLDRARAVLEHAVRSKLDDLIASVESDAAAHAARAAARAAAMDAAYGPAITTS